MHTPQENNFGLTDRDLLTIRGIFNKYSDVRLVYLFGSRAKGNFKPGSDIDLAIMNSDLDPATLRRIVGELEDSSLPYRVDLVAYHAITHPEFQEHIDRVGLVFFEQSPERNIKTEGEEKKQNK
jgi:predicted nucleotidyltransferase